MNRWIAALVAAVAALGLVVPLTVMLITTQPACGSAVDALGAAGQQSSSKDEAGVWLALRAAGFDDVHAAGVMGNMQAESGFDPQIVQGGGHSTRPADAGSAGYGLVQWTPGEKLSDYIGSATPTVANQVATLKAQLEGRGPHPEKAAGDAFWTTRDVESAARTFHLRYERSASTNSAQRVSNARAIFQRRQGQGAPAGGAAGGAATTTAKAAIVAYAKQVSAPATPHLDPDGKAAFDIMSRGDLNSTIADELRTHHAAYGARYVISQMRIASARSDWAWRPYTPITSSGDFQHTGHVHISYTDGPVSASGAAAGAGQGVGCLPGAMPAAKIITWNSFHGSRYPDQRHGNDQRVVEGMLELAKAGDVIGAQELSDSDRKAAVNKAMDGVDWAFVATHTSHPIYFNRKVWTLVDDDTTEVYERGDAIEGNDQGDRYIVTAVLRSNATGQLLTVINMHQLPHIQKHGVLNKKQPKRIAMAVAAWREMAAAVAKHKQDSAVVVVGDMNYDGDPRGMYAAAGLTMASKVFGNQNTLRKREIDQILFTTGRPVAQQILPRYGSDHHARMVTFAAQSGAAGAGDGPVPASFDQQGNPRTVEQAVAWMQAAMPRGARGEPVLNACERYMNLAYGIGGGYPTALSHWNAAGPKSAGYSTPPRGALVFWRTGNPAGHVALSLGNGMVVSTDYDASTHRYRAGMLSVGPITDIDRWGERLGWRAPNFRAGSERA